MNLTWLSNSRTNLMSTTFPFWINFERCFWFIRNVPESKTTVGSFHSKCKTIRIGLLREMIVFPTEFFLKMILISFDYQKYLFPPNRSSSFRLWSLLVGNQGWNMTYAFDNWFRRGEHVFEMSISQKLWKYSFPTKTSDGLQPFCIHEMVLWKKKQDWKQRKLYHNSNQQNLLGWKLINWIEFESRKDISCQSARLCCWP